jgi:hypothetical protein
MIDYRKVFRDALVGRGYAPYRAEMLVAEFADAVADGARQNSDHAAYRKLADAVSLMVNEVSDPDNWDGDDSEVGILIRFVQWAPDMIAHQVADKIRSQALGGQYAADFTDPFEKNRAGQWVRKADGAPVPWPVVTS